MPDKEFYPHMTHGERLQLLVHTHFEPNRIVLARRRIQFKIDSGIKPDRHDDYRARLNEYEVRLEQIRDIWTSAPAELVEEAHARIATLDAHGQPRRNG